MIGTLIRSYGITKYLPAVLKSYSWVDKIVVMNHRFKGVREVADNTPEIVQDNAIIRTGQDLLQHEVLNLGLEEFSGFDNVFIADADELISLKDQKTLVEEIGDQDACTVKLIDYIDSLEFRADERTHKPIVLVKPHVRFYEIRCMAGNIKHVDIYMHHLGYVFGKEDMEWKLEWERIYERGTTDDILCNYRHPQQMPDDIKEFLS